MSWQLRKSALQRAQFMCRQACRTGLARGFSSSITRHDANDPFPIFRDVPTLRSLRRTLFREGREVGFVPTMGALHGGHLSLIQHALTENQDVFVSIFVNPTQFGVNEDLDSYPKTWEQDLAKLVAAEEEFKATDQGKTGSRIRGIFAPSVKIMYPTLPPSSDIAGDGSFVTITPLGKWLEGRSRPIFFRGVATVCTKLFNIVQPDRVYFGQKDIQQSMLIKRMVTDFHIPTEVRVVPTTREPDGLAMSSRNVYLGERRRKDAVVLSRALFAAQKLYRDSGVTSAGEIRRAAFDVFESETHREGGLLFGRTGGGMIETDYIALSRADDMSEIGDREKVDPKHGAILSAAMKMSAVEIPWTDEERDQVPVRLIDNVILEPRQA